MPQAELIRSMILNTGRNKTKRIGVMQRYFESRQIGLSALAVILAHIGLVTAALL